MWRLGRLLPRTILVILSILAGIGVVRIAPGVSAVLERALEISHRGESLAEAGGAGCGSVQAARYAPDPVAARPVTPSVVSLTATPLRAAPLDTVTFAATVLEGGDSCGPYSATLQLVREQGALLRSLPQSGVMLRRNQPLSLYWEWRAGTSLPYGTYAMRVELGTLSLPRHVVATFTASQRLIILPR